VGRPRSAKLERAALTLQLGHLLLRQGVLLARLGRADLDAGLQGIKEGYCEFQSVSSRSTKLKKINQSLCCTNLADQLEHFFPGFISERFL
jgi:hypothetical protein